MNTQTHKDTFQLLSELGLITRAHCEAALVHPRLDELESLPGPAQALVWLVARNIVKEKNSRPRPFEARPLYSLSSNCGYGMTL